MLRWVRIMWRLRMSGARVWCDGLVGVTGEGAGELLTAPGDVGSVLVIEGVGVVEVSPVLFAGVGGPGGAGVGEGLGPGVVDVVVAGGELAFASADACSAAWSGGVPGDELVGHCLDAASSGPDTTRPSPRLSGWVW